MNDISRAEFKDVRDMAHNAHSTALEAKVHSKSTHKALENHLEKHDAKNNWILISVITIAVTLIVDKLGWIPMGA